MSRSGYTDDCEDMWAHIRWRGAVSSAIRGKRGQQFLREALAALDAMEDKRLTAHNMVADGDFCTLGAVGKRRGMEDEALSALAEDGYADREAISKVFGIPEALAAEIMFENDESISDEIHEAIELPGPVRPRFPEWGRLVVHTSRPDPTAPHRRWLRMRNWIAAQIKPEAPAA